ncbi:hypothetical protein MMPV_001924 [Pyropia vietnamensis]
MPRGSAGAFATGADTQGIAVKPSTRATDAASGRADAVALAACVAASRAYLRGRVGLFHGEGGANVFKAALRRRAGALAATDGSGAAAGGPPRLARPSGCDGGGCGGGGGGGGDTSANPTPPPPLVVDVGANAGQGFSTWRSAFPGATIVAIEANPTLVADLRWVAQRGAAGGVGRTHVIHKTVGAADGRAAVFRIPVHARHGQTGGLWVGATRPQPQKYKYVAVPVLPLDKLLAPPHTPAWLRPATNRTYPISILKTDVEGWDIPLLLSAPDTVASARFILFECHALMAIPGGPGSTHAAAAAGLAAAGFEVYKLGRERSVRLDGPFAMADMDEPGQMGWHNCAAVRRDEPLRVGVVRELGVLDECVGPYGVGS